MMMHNAAPDKPTALLFRLQVSSAVRSKKMKKKRVKSKIARLLSAQGIAFSQISFEEKSVYQERWRRVFSNKKAIIENDEYETFDWETFSYGLTPRFEHDSARNEYRTKEVAEYLVLPHAIKEPGLHCYSSKLADFSRKNVDVYIVDLAFSWTMVFTHEDDWIGPFYCDVDLLRRA